MVPDRESWLQGDLQGLALLHQGLGPACWGGEGAHKFKAAFLLPRFILITFLWPPWGSFSQAGGRRLIRALVAVPVEPDPSGGRGRGTGRAGG